MREVEVPGRPSKLPWILLAVAALSVVALILFRKTPPPSTGRLGTEDPGSTAV